MESPGYVIITNDQNVYVGGSRDPSTAMQA